MAAVRDRVEEFTGREEYKAMTLAQKRAAGEKLLKELAAEGLVKEGSIEVSDDCISYRFSSGVVGIIMLRESEPMLN